MSIIEVLNVTRNDVFKKNIIAYFRFGIIMGIVFLIFLLLYLGLYFLFTKKKKYTFLIDTCQFGTIIFGGLALACFAISGSLRLCIFLDNQIDILDKLLLYLIKFHMIIILILGLMLWIIFKKRKNYSNQEIILPKFISFLLKNSFGTKEILLSPEEYENFIYEKNIILDEDYIIHINNRHNQHIVSYSTGGKEKELRSSQFNTWKSIYIFEDRTANFMEMTKYFLKLQEISYIEIIMDKNIKDISKFQNNNFPRFIKFLDKNKKVLLKLEFNEFGFMVKVIDENGNTIFEDKEILGAEDIRKLIRKNLNTSKGE